MRDVQASSEGPLIVTGEPMVSYDVAYHLAANRVRRAVIRVLASRPEGAESVDTLVDELVGRVDGADDLDRPREELRVALHHRHLPAFEDAGIVEFDPDAGDVRYDTSPRLEEVVALSAPEL